MSRNDAGSPPIAHFDLATRLIHLALVAFGVTALVSGDFAGDYKRARRIRPEAETALDAACA
ncbi:MAG: hypothetical protein A2W21_03180 [Betaproteobacteria bacterium RBG_16_66_20]|nr:MAG: hypothetical protein A2W21_03180 [Betaproteobacteria bacterium RBG_16_66_20]